jgi:hypothetical protein
MINYSTNINKTIYDRPWLGTGVNYGEVKLVNGIPNSPLLITGSPKAIHIYIYSFHNKQIIINLYRLASTRK